VTELVAVGTVVRLQDLRLGPAAAGVREHIGFAWNVDARGAPIETRCANQQRRAVECNCASELAAVARCTVTAFELLRLRPGASSVLEDVGSAFGAVRTSVMAVRTDNGGVAGKLDGPTEIIGGECVGGGQLLGLGPVAAALRKHVRGADGTD